LSGVTGGAKVPQQMAPSHRERKKTGRKKGKVSMQIVTGVPCRERHRPAARPGKQGQLVEWDRKKEGENHREKIGKKDLTPWRVRHAGGVDRKRRKTTWHAQGVQTSIKKGLPSVRSMEKKKKSLKDRTLLAGSRGIGPLGKGARQASSALGLSCQSERPWMKSFNNEGDEGSGGREIAPLTAQRRQQAGLPRTRACRQVKTGGRNLNVGNILHG